MVRIMTYAKYCQNSIFLSFLKNVKRLYLRFLILLIFVVIVFFDSFDFGYLRGKINNLEIIK